MRLFLLALASVSLATAATADGAYAAHVQDWRNVYETSLKADDGWLTLAGLFWLKPGVNTAGSADGSDVLLPPGSAPAHIGVFRFHGNITVFRAEAGVPVLVNGRSVAEAPLKADSDGVPDLVQIGDFTMLVIHRGQRYGIRVKDKRSPARVNFTGLRWYPVKEEYRVVAEFHSYPKPKLIPIPNILGDTLQTPCPGYATFTLRGANLRLEAVAEDGRLFFVFKDRTAGKTTYGSGRFLNADMPVEGKVTLDFNQAYSPPCAFTPYATCPLPPAANHLAVAIEAGEMKYGDR